MPRTRLDHILIGAPDLDSAIVWWEKLTGVDPTLGGAHEGHGTHNALVSLGEHVYLELLAPDLDQPPGSPLRDSLAALESPRPVGWCFSSDDLDQTQRNLSGGEIEWHPVPMSRVMPNGERVAWKLLIPASPQNPALPFVIDWEETPRPTELPEGCRLLKVLPTHPEPARLKALFVAMGLDTDVTEGPESGLELLIDTPRGEIRVSSGHSPD